MLLYWTGPRRRAASSRAHVLLHVNNAHSKASIRMAPLPGTLLQAQKAAGGFLTFRRPRRRTLPGRIIARPQERGHDAHAGRDLGRWCRLGPEGSLCKSGCLGNRHLNEPQMARHTAPVAISVPAAGAHVVARPDLTRALSPCMR